MNLNDFTVLRLYIFYSMIFRKCGKVQAYKFGKKASEIREN